MREVLVCEMKKKSGAGEKKINAMLLGGVCCGERSEMRQRDRCGFSSSWSYLFAAGAAVSNVKGRQDAR